jgi:hypothetical protein
MPSPECKCPSLEMFAKQQSRTSIIYIKLVMIKHAAGIDKLASHL